MSLGLVDARRTLFAWPHCANFDGGGKTVWVWRKLSMLQRTKTFFLQFCAFNLVQTIWRSPFSIPKGPVQIERYIQTWLGKFGVEEVFVSRVSWSNICVWPHKRLVITTDTTENCGSCYCCKWNQPHMPMYIEGDILKAVGVMARCPNTFAHVVYVKITRLATYLHCFLQPGISVLLYTL